MSQLKSGDKCLVIGANSDKARARNVGKTITIIKQIADGEWVTPPGEFEKSMFVANNPQEAPYFTVEGDVGAFRRKVTGEIYMWREGWSIVSHKYLMKIDGFEGNELESNLYDKVTENGTT